MITLEKGPVQIQKLMTDIPGTAALLLGVLALILASVGVYGVVMYLGSQRIRAIEIHMALSAQRLDVIWLVLAALAFAVAAACLLPGVPSKSDRPSSRTPDRLESQGAGACAPAGHVE